MEQLYDSANFVSEYLSDKNENAKSKRYIILILIAALVITPKTWKQPKCPSTDEWIKKVCYRYTTELYSAIKKNETLPFTETWIDLENVKWGQCLF